jgi:hypothetical protein
MGSPSAAAVGDAVAAERLRLAGFVAKPSPCEAWPVRDVIAHLTTTTRTTRERRLVASRTRQPPMDPLMDLVIHAQDIARGAEVRGPDIEPLLVAAGRPAGLAALDGPAKAIVSGRR